MLDDRHPGLPCPGRVSLDFLIAPTPYRGRGGAPFENSTSRGHDVGRTVSRDDFNAHYDALITGRAFVENIDYYRQSRERYWQAVTRFAALDPKPGQRILDIGGGQFAILANRLFGLEGFVGDAVESAAADVEAAGLGFARIDLFADRADHPERYDFVSLLEVIEHIPEPPHVVLRRVSALVADGGAIFMTTPNGHRFRNVVYMLLGREIVDLYRYPAPNEVLGHQHEYTMKHLRWQLEAADLDVAFLDYYEDGWRGASRAAQIAWTLARPFGLIPRLRNGLVAAARPRRRGGEGAGSARTG